MFRNVAARVVVVSAAALFLGSGCDNVQSPHSVRRDLLPNKHYPTVTVEASLEDALVIDAPKVTPGDSERPLTVIIPLRNVEDNEIHIQYRMEFFDSAGRPMTRGDQWRFKTLPSRTQVFLEGGAIDTKSVDYRAIIRSAR